MATPQRAFRRNDVSRKERGTWIYRPASPGRRANNNHKSAFAGYRKSQGLFTLIQWIRLWLKKHQCSGPRREARGASGTGRDLPRATNALAATELPT